MKPVRMLLTSLVLLLELTTLTLGHQEDECGGILSIVPFVDMIDAIEYYSRCTFTAYKLNVSCILYSCPLLRGVCPLTSNKSVNHTALNTAVSILTSCLEQSGLICGINISRTPLVQLAWTTNQVIPASMANGTMTLNPGTGYISNLSKSTFTVNQTALSPWSSTLPISPARSIAAATSAYPAPLSSGPSLSYFRPSPSSAFPTCTASTTSTSPPPSPSTSAPNPPPSTPSTVTSIWNHFSPRVFLSPVVEKVFNEGMDMFLKQSVIPLVVTNILATYAALALKGAQEGCP